MSGRTLDDQVTRIERLKGELEAAEGLSEPYVVCTDEVVATSLVCFMVLFLQDDDHIAGLHTGLWVDAEQLFSRIYEDRMGNNFVQMAPEVRNL